MSQFHIGKCTPISGYTFLLGVETVSWGMRSISVIVFALSILFLSLAIADSPGSPKEIAVTLIPSYFPIQLGKRFYGYGLN